MLLADGALRAPPGSARAAGRFGDCEIGWASELVEIADDADIFADRAVHASASNRATNRSVSLAASSPALRKSGGAPRSSRSPAASTSSAIERSTPRPGIEEVVARSPELIVWQGCGRNSRPELAAGSLGSGATQRGRLLGLAQR